MAEDPTHAREVRSRCDVLIFVEDPGAANCIASLPPLLAERGHRVLLFAAGSSVNYLRERGIAAEELSREATASAIVETAKPLVLLAGTALDPGTMGLKLIDACRARGIVSVGVVDTRANAAHRFRGLTTDPLAHAPDWLIVPDEQSREIFAALGFPRAAIRVCGHPHYDEVRAAGMLFAAKDRTLLRQQLFPGLREPRPVILLLTEPFGGLNDAEDRRTPDYTLLGRGTSERRNDIVIEEFLDAAKQLQPTPYIVLRLHPKNRAAEFKRYEQEFDQISTGGSPLEMVYAADLAVGMTSMLLLEAALLGRPTLAVLPRAAEKEWLPAPADGAIPSVTDRDALRAVLPDLLRDKTPGPIRGLVLNAKQQMLGFLLERLDRALSTTREGKAERHG